MCLFFSVTRLMCDLSSEASKCIESLEALSFVAVCFEVYFKREEHASEFDIQ